jgi:hypothetical protein
VCRFLQANKLKEQGPHTRRLQHAGAAAPHAVDACATSKAQLVCCHALGVSTVCSRYPRIRSRSLLFFSAVARCFRSAAAASSSAAIHPAHFLLPPGNSAFAKGDHKGAIAAFTEALTFDPNSVALLSNRSAAYAAIGKDGQQTEPNNNGGNDWKRAGGMRRDAMQRR